MMHGVVPYRDLFDQKGILLYFLYGIGYLFFRTTFAGVFILEVIAGALSIGAILKILQLYVSAQSAYILTPLTAACMYSARSFYWGGSAEEFLMPALVWGLYLLLRALTQEGPDALSPSVFFTGGILAGVVFHIKFSSIGFYIGWVAVVILMVLTDKSDRRLARLCKGAGLFLAGVILVTLPFVLYFGIHGAIDDWFRVYIYDNLFIYSKTLSPGERIYGMCKTVYNQMMANKRFAVWIVAGVVLPLFCAIRDRSRRTILTWGTIVVTLALLTTVIFIGGVDLPYYPFPMSAFTVTGVVACARLAEGLFRSRRDEERGDAAGKLSKTLPLMALGILLATGLCYRGSMNAPEIGMKQEELCLFRLRDHIRARGVEDPKIINMGGFDAGLYTLLDSVPECYYFQTQTIPLPGIWETQKDYVQSGGPDFVLSCFGYFDFAMPGYRYVGEVSQFLAGQEFHFWLYEREEYADIGGEGVIVD